MNNGILKFIIRGVLFFALFVSLLLIVNNIYINLILAKMNIYRSEDQFEKYDKQNLNIIFFGDSIPDYAINPAIIDNSFNYGATYETYDQTYHKVSKILNEDNNTNLLVLPLNLNSFNTQNNNSYENIRYWAKFMTVKDIASASGKSETFVFINKYFPFVGNGIDFKEIIFPSPATEIILGWQKHTESLSEANKISLPINDPIPAESIDFFDEEKFKYFMKIMELAELKNKTVVLIKFPMTEEAYISYGINRASYYNRIVAETKKYENVVLLDYQDLFDNEDYYLFNDIYHLNYKGAEELTKRIKNDLVEFKLIED